MPPPSSVKIYEVGPRDGLQNERTTISTEVKIELIERLRLSGIRNIEVTSFVSPKWVPQMADHCEVTTRLNHTPEICYSALTPNLKGLEKALECGVKEVAIFGAASESFSKKNINCSVSESLSRFEAVASRAISAGVRVRGYVSCVLGCPYEGEVSFNKVSEISRELYAMGCYEISLGDTIGTGTPIRAKKMLEAVRKEVPLDNLAAHFHDSYGQALANLYAVIEEGLGIIDSSVAGLGGCPYAKGATGNVATEDVIYMLNGMGIHTGVDIKALSDTGKWISEVIGCENRSKASNALSI